MNLQVISGRLLLKEKTGNAVVHFIDHGVTGDAVVHPDENFPDGAINGPLATFRGRPHVILSLNEASLSTHDNTRYNINREIREDSLSLDWEIDRAGAELNLDFLVIGEAAG